MRTAWIVIAAVNGGLAVAAGAFGAHGLKERLSAEMLTIFETAARYQMYHALAMLATAVVAGLSRAREGGGSVRVGGRAFGVALWAFLVGIVLFSGSLYVLALSGVKAWGAVTPFGGVAFLFGWAALAWGCVSSRRTTESAT